MSPAVAGRFLTAGPAGKASISSLCSGAASPARFCEGSRFCLFHSLLWPHLRGRASHTMGAKETFVARTPASGASCPSLCLHVGQGGRPDEWVLDQGQAVHVSLPSSAAARWGITGGCLVFRSPGGLVSHAEGSQGGSLFAHKLMNFSPLWCLLKPQEHPQETKKRLRY